ncbi:GNAT family N-acetyltransferase [Chryseomicrobium excrementi]|uniref:GNAT family N-acetyltransferase n=1 Tax=Chryseomicrobium excrementi TaxID=2041346 RepID=A0A2M9EXT8_9BACL|nr:GNAT family protein [Chryseomicrobium excrementi]PJK16037.1 GNAT family N-acetyltransferase [Chryseomicrobium excrementi]
MNLQNNGVTLRPLVQTDIHVLWETFEPEVYAHMLTRVERKEQLVGWLQYAINRMQTHGDMLIFGVVDERSQQLVGTTRLYDIDKQHRSAEIGATIYATSAQRTHINTTCKFLLLSYAFEELNLVRVQIRTDAENAASQRAIERIGFVKEGYLRNEKVRSTGKPRNTYLYSMIDSEWPEAKEKLIEMMNKYT